MTGGFVQRLAAEIQWHREKNEKHFNSMFYSVTPFCQRQVKVGSGSGRSRFHSHCTRGLSHTLCQVCKWALMGVWRCCHTSQETEILTFHLIFIPFDQKTGNVAVIFLHNHINKILHQTKVHANKQLSPSAALVMIFM